MKKFLSLFGTIAFLSACTFTVTTDVDKGDAEPAEETVEEGTVPNEDTAPVVDEMPDEEEAPAEEDLAEQAPSEEEPAMEEETVEDGGDGNNADGGGTTVEVNVEAGTADDSSSEASAE